MVKKPLHINLLSEKDEVQKKKNVLKVWVTSELTLSNPAAYAKLSIAYLID